MAALDRPTVKPRPIYLNLLAIRQPLPAIVSVLHRVSGALLFLLGIPLLLWGIHASLASPDTFAWSYIHHLLAGLRHLALDLHVGVDLAPARRSAAIVLVVSVLLTAMVAVRLW